MSPEQALQAAQAFIAITYPVASHNDTKTVAAARQSSRAVQQVRPLVEEGQNIGYVADLDGTGYVLLSADDGAPPIKCHSEEGSFDRLPPGFLAVLKLELAEDLSVLAEMNQAKRTAGKTAGIVSTEYTAQWQELLNPGLTSKTTTPALFAAAGTYLLTTKWDQGSPYNYYCPVASGGPGGRAWAGCSAVPFAQIIRYWGYPRAVLADHTYSDNEGACTGSHSISDAGMSDYQWANMPASLSASSSTAQKQAMGQLIYHAAVALESDFEHDGTAASMGRVQTVFRDFFSYACNDIAWRSSFTDADWYGQIVADITANKPIYYAMWTADFQSGHALVCDGYRSGNQVHFNLGWGSSSAYDPSGTWYSLDSVVTGTYKWTEHGAVFGITPNDAVVAYRSHAIDDDDSGSSSGNGDGVANPGEDIELKVKLSNRGSSVAHNVGAVISTTDRYVDITDDDLSWGDIDAGASDEASDFDFVVAANCPSGRAIKFTLSITADEGAWSETFTIIVDGYPELSYDGHRIDDDTSTSSGNNDGRVNPGETIEMPLTLHNAGFGGANDIEAILTTSDPYITITDEDVTWSAIPAGSTEEARDFDFVVAAGCPVGHWVVFNLEITADEGSWNDSFQVLVDGEPSLAVAPAITNVSAAAGSGKRIGVSANVPWTAAENQSWIMIATGGAGSGNGTITFNVEANSGVIRFGAITVTGGGLSRTCTVVQAGLRAYPLGTPWPLPGAVEAENFDLGGSGVAYGDATPANEGGQYRTGEGVDIANDAGAGNGRVVGWTSAGEWLEYTVSLSASGTYALETRVAAVGAGGQFRILVNGEDKTGLLAVPNTGAWNAYQTVSKGGVALSSGIQTVRVEMVTAGPSGNVGAFDWFRVAAETPVVQTAYPSGTPWPLPGTVEAENFDQGGAGAAYGDATPANEGGQYRTGESVDIANDAGAGNGRVVGWTSAGEWLEYTVSLSASGTYALETRVAAVGAGGQFRILVNGVDKTGLLAVPNTGAWNAYQVVQKTGVALSSGIQTVRVEMVTAGSGGHVGAFDWFRVAGASPVLAISPSSASVSAEASNGRQIAVTANLAWTAATNVPWIQITSGFAGTTDGTVTYGVVANGGATARTGAVIVAGGGFSRTCAVVQAGSAAAVPILVEAEDFANGGQGAAYNDTTPANEGRAYRTGEGVDIAADVGAGNGHVVGWTPAGEWIQYVVNVTVAGIYTLETRVAGVGAGGQFRIVVNGVDKTGLLAVPNTGAWNAYQVVQKTDVSLSSGIQTVRVAMATAGPSGHVMAFDWFRLVPVSMPVQTAYPNGTPWPLPGTVETENFDNGGQGLAYGDTTSGNAGGAYRVGEGVDIARDTDAGGGHVVGWNPAGEWLEYTVSLSASGTYALETRVAAVGAGGQFRILVNGVDKTGLLAVPNTGAWTAYQTVSKGGVALSSGIQTVRVEMVTAGPSGHVGAFDWFRVASAARRAPSTSDAVAAMEELPLPVEVRSSQEDQQPGEGWLAVDGDVKTTWPVVPSAGGGWLVLTYDPQIALNGLAIDWASDSPTNSQFLYSLDADTWIELVLPLTNGPVNLNHLWLLFPGDELGKAPAIREIRVE